MPKPKILLLEDDTNLSETIGEFLEENGFAVEYVYDGNVALEKIYETKYDLLLLDVNVPGMRGFALLKEARKMNVLVPAIFITSLNSIDDLSVGFESGCDDYIRKPFELKELLLRIKTLLGRDFFHPPAPKLPIDSHLSYDTQTGELYQEGQRVALGNKESRLLKIFLQHKNELILHETLYDRLWDYDETPSESALRTYIKNLRKILGKEKIVSIKKIGYKLVTE